MPTPGRCTIGSGSARSSSTLVAPLTSLGERLRDRPRGPSAGSIHVQTDDADAVIRAVEIYVPRLPGGSRGSVVTTPQNGWTAVYDELCDREPEMLRRLAHDLSNRMGAVVLSIGVEHDAVVRYVLFERGRIVDEYLSVPEFYGPLPPGDVVGLGANPTVAHRLTGADPGRVREIARIAPQPGRAPARPRAARAACGTLRARGRRARVRAGPRACRRDVARAVIEIGSAFGPSNDSE